MLPLGWGGGTAGLEVGRWPAVSSPLLVCEARRGGWVHGNKVERS